MLKSKDEEIEALKEQTYIEAGEREEEEVKGKMTKTVQKNLKKKKKKEDTKLATPNKSKWRATKPTLCECGVGVSVCVY